MTSKSCPFGKVIGMEFEECEHFKECDDEEFEECRLTSIELEEKDNDSEEEENDNG